MDAVMRWCRDWYMEVGTDKGKTETCTFPGHSPGVPEPAVVLATPLCAPDRGAAEPGGVSAGACAAGNTSGASTAAAGVETSLLAAATSSGGSTRTCETMRRDVCMENVSPNNKSALIRVSREPATSAHRPLRSSASGNR